MALAYATGPAVVVATGASSKVIGTIAAESANAIVVVVWFGQPPTTGKVISSLTGVSNITWSLLTVQAYSGSEGIFSCEVWTGFVGSGGSSSGTLTANFNTSTLAGILRTYYITGGSYLNPTVYANTGPGSIGVSGVSGVSGDVLMCLIVGCSPTNSYGTGTWSPAAISTNMQTGNAGADPTGYYTIGAFSYAALTATLSSVTETLNPPTGNTASVLIFIDFAQTVPVFTKTFSETFSVTDTLQFSLARVFATETGIQAVFQDFTAIKSHGHVPPALVDSGLTSSFADLGIVKGPGKLPKETVMTITETFSKVHMPGGPQTFTEALLSISDTFSWHGSFHPTFSEVLNLLEPVFGTVQGHFASLTDTFTLSDLFNAVHAEFLAFAEAIVLLDLGSSLTYDQQLNFAEAFALSDSISETYAQLLAAAEAFTVSDVFSAVHTDRLTLTDVIALVESFLEVYTPGGGGLVPVLAIGALAGTSTAAAVVAALIFATAQGNGRIAGLAAVAYQVSALLRGLCILNGLAGEHIVEAGAATGGSSASGIEGAQIVVVGGSTEGDSDAESDAGVWTAPTGEADGVSPEIDCDTQCIFCAEGNTMSDTPGSAVAVATYALLHLIATLRGASLAVAQVYSPVVASGDCKGESTAEYVSIALYDAEAVGGESEAIGIAGGLFHAVGECNPIMTSNAKATANYGPGQIGALVRGRGVVAGAPTLLVM